MPRLEREGCARTEGRDGAHVKKLKPGQKITVVLLGDTWRATALRRGKGRVYFKLVDLLKGEKGYRGSADPRAEGIAWARGWDTDAAKALKSATALL